MRCAASTCCCCWYLLSSPTPSWEWVVCIGRLSHPLREDIRRWLRNDAFCSVSCRSTTARCSPLGGDDVGKNPLLRKEMTDQLALYLSDTVRMYLDDEWVPQDGHAQVARRVELAYKQAVLENGAMYVRDVVKAIVNDLQGHECMNKINVEVRDIASICSDFLIKKMGLETAVAAASAYVPHPAKLSEGKQEKLTGTAVEPVRVINCTVRYTKQLHPYKLPPPTAEEVDNLMLHLNSNFSRYRWISQVIEGEVNWREVSIIVAIMQLGASVVLTSPVIHLKEDNVVLESLQQILPEDEDSLKELDEFIEHIYGKDSKRVAEASSCNLDFSHRAIVAKFLYTKGFLNDEFYVASQTL